MRYLIDVGTSSVKLYEHNNEKTTLIEKKSYRFSKEYKNDNPMPIVEEDRKIIYEIFCTMVSKYSLNKGNTKLFATGHFRNIANKREFINEFYQETHLYFNIISQELESFYLDNKFSQYSKEIGQMMAINIGGGSTEIICYKNGTAERLPNNFNFGTNLIREKFPQINDVDDESMLHNVIEYVLDMLPDLEEKYKTVVLTGGELTFMKICGYPLEKNHLCADKNHPCLIDMHNYFEYNKKIYSESIDYLLSKMPESPGWMLGARAYCAIAQAFCQKYGVEYIIPSDYNMIDGVVMQEARNITICGSFNKHLRQIAQLIKELKAKGYNILSPSNTEVVGDENGFLIFENNFIKNHCTWPIESDHLDAIEKADLVIICNYGGYIGYSTTMEIGAAYMRNKKLVFIEDNDMARELDSPFEIGLIM